LRAQFLGIQLAKLGLDKVHADAAAASASAAAFITNAVKEAKAHGLEFTEEEAQAYMAGEAKAAASGELPGTQLKAVAGGKKPQRAFLTAPIDEPQADELRGAIPAAQALFYPNPEWIKK
jgi:hypothetical protein